MKDVIDERNRREKMHKSVIKYWNVSYSPVRSTPQSTQATPMEAETVSEEENQKRGQIDKILHEKTDAIRNIVEHNGMI